MKSKSKDGITEIVTAKGAVRYLARVHRAGYPERSKRFKTRNEALVWKRNIDASIDQGKPVLDSKKVLIKQIVEDYLRYREKSIKKLPENRVTEYEKVVLDLGSFAIENLDRIDLENWLQLLQTESRGKFSNGDSKPSYAEASARKFFYALKTAVDWHSAQNRYHVSEFLFQLPKGAVPRAWAGNRERRLSQSEEIKLYEAGIERKNTYTTENWKRIIGFALETAMREQEIVLARWQDIRQDGYKLFLPAEHTKSKKDRTVLLSGRAREIIKAQKLECPENEKRIFFQVPNSPSLCDAFARLTKRAKLEDLKFHDLRHEATSRLCESGKLSLMHIMEMTGHASMATFVRYLHLMKSETSVILE
jgi:integrase